MKKILFNILTCNRLFYFKNCIQSIIEFVDLNDIDILICDNNTIEKGFDEYCEFLCKKYNNIEIKKFKKRRKNELYHAMNWGIKYALKNNYDILHFIQDDYQYLFRRTDYLRNIIDFFNKFKKVVQINSNLVWERKNKGIGQVNIKEVNGENFAILLSKVPCDNGFTRVSIYNKIGLYPEDTVSWSLKERGKRYIGKTNGEIWFGRQCTKNKLRRAISLYPNMTMMYDCAYVRGHKRFGNYFPPKNKYYILPFDNNKVEKIMKNNRDKKWSFIEKMCCPDEWKPNTYNKHSPLKYSENI